jgi:Domain of unknown function (DUF6817)
MTHQEDMLAFLAAQGADALDHSEADLLSHLLGVQGLLQQWGAREAVCDAGLFHSVYGTEYFTEIAVSLALRPKVQALIGDEAEALAHAFATMHRETLYDNLFDGRTEYAIRSRLTEETIPLTRQQFRDLCDITLANWYEQRLRVPAEIRSLTALEFHYMRPYLLPAACAALDAA